MLTGPGSARAFRYSVSASAGLVPRRKTDHGVAFLDAEDNVSTTGASTLTSSAGGYTRHATPMASFQPLRSPSRRAAPE